MTRQWKLLRDELGADTHVRNLEEDIFQRSASKSYKIKSGEIEFPQPEPAFTQTAVSVKLTKGGTLTGVPYPGAFIDPISGNLHGTYEGPIPGQMVKIAFEEGNSQAPFIVNRYPYQGVGNSLTEDKYMLPMTQAGFNAMDVIIGHFTGSYLSFNTGAPLPGETPGSVTLNAMTGLTLQSKLGISITCFTDIELSTLTKVTIDGTFIELNGNTDFAVNYTPLASAWSSLLSAINAELLKIQTSISGCQAGAGGVYIPGTISTSITGAKNATVLL
jgi:hypothetical protein